MTVKLVIDGNAVYEIDEECMECRKKHAEYEEKQKVEKRTEASAGSQKKNTPSI